MGSALQIIAIIDALLGLALRMHSVAKQLAGDEPIPTVEEILSKQITLDAELEAAKADVG